MLWRRARCGANARPTGSEPVRRYGAQAHRANVIGGISFRHGIWPTPCQYTQAVHSGRCMPLFSLEHSKVAYWFDLGIFGGASTSLAALLVLFGPRAKAIQIIAYAAVGLASWTLIEYGLHRFVLHGLKPFSGWH